MSWKNRLEYTFKCRNCHSQITMTPTDIIKYLNIKNNFHCLRCLDDYRICEYCKSKNPLGNLECLYCGYIEVPV